VFRPRNGCSRRVAVARLPDLPTIHNNAHCLKSGDMSLTGRLCDSGQKAQGLKEQHVSSLGVVTKMTEEKSRGTKTHKNKEKTVQCPVEGCEKEVLSRGLHLHVRRSSGGGHGEQDEIPPDINLDDAKVVGDREVEMDYPEHRDSEQVARLCPYCERPFRGKHGVMIHLGQVAGRKNHPEDAPKRHEPDDFSIVHVDENENVVEVVEEGTSMPSTERRLEKTDIGIGSLNEEKVQEYIEGLREQGLDSEAERAEKMLLGSK
jgi:hypothetical protein